MANAHTIVGEVREQKRDFELLAEDPTVIPPSLNSLHFIRSKERKYFESINWPEWWTEFNQPGKTSGWKYLKLGSFIKSRTSIHWQQIVIQQAIGTNPKTTRTNGKVTLKTPYLGDWTRRRRNGFYVFDDPVKAQAVQEALEQKKEARAATMALAPDIAKGLAFWDTVRAQIIEAYGGRAIRADQAIGPKQVEKLDRFIAWCTKIDERKQELRDQWMKVHGVNPMDPAQQHILAGQIGAAAALTGVMAAGGQIPGRPILIQDGVELPLPEAVSYDAILLAQHLKSHAQRFPELPEEVQKTNGKHKSSTQ